MAFYDIFESLCAENGVTPTQVARDNGMKQSAVAMWKKRGSTPNGGTLAKLSNYFGVTVDYLLGNVSEPFFYLDNERIIREINSYSDDDLIPENRIAAALGKLNDEGKEKAADIVEIIAEVPRYRAQQSTQATPADSTEDCHEDEWDRYGGRRDE